MMKQVFLPSIHDTHYICFPEAVGWYHNEPNHAAIRTKNNFNFFNLHVVLNGKGYLKTNNEIHVLNQGDAFFYFPMEEQYYYSDKENPWEVVWLHFEGDYIKDFFIEKGFHLSNVWTLKLWDNINQSLLKLLHESEEYGILHPSRLSSITYEIIAEFISQAEPLSINNGLGIYKRIVKILPKMRQMQAKPFELKYWADELNISTFYFSKMFKKTTGLSPTNFIMLCRLQKAKQLLVEQKDLTVKQIAIECGYPSISYFGKLFLENEGLTPLEYRNKYITF